MTRFETYIIRYKTQKATTPEILALCGDLKVLGKMDFKRLLRWRTAVIQATKMEEESEEEEEEPEEVKELTPEEEEEKLNQDLKAQIVNLQNKKKKEHKKELKKKRKLQEKLQLKMVLPSDTIEMQDDIHMFNLNTIKTSDQLKKLDEVNFTTIMDEEEQEEAGYDAFEDMKDFVNLDKVPPAYTLPLILLATRC
jgi:AdoMet-dependent rRNA methyltransferase SPB1